MKLQVQTTKREGWYINLKSIALFSVAVYIVLSTVFDGMASSLARLSSLGMYFCLGVCGAYILIVKRVRINWCIITLLILGAILSISCLYTKASSGVVEMYIYQYWTTFILLLFASNVPEDMKDIRFLLSAIVIAGTVLAIYLYAFYGLEHLMSIEERLDKELGNQNSSALKCTLAIVLSIYNMAIGKSKARFLWWIPVVICLPAVMFLASRKSIVVLLAAIFAFYFVYGGNRGLIKRLAICAVLFAIVLYLINTVPMFGVIKGRFEELFALFDGSTKDTNQGDLNRQVFIEDGWRAFLESPIWGNGFYYSDYLFGVYAHNNYIELLMNNGLLGFCCYYFIHVKILRKAWMLRKKDPKVSALAIMMMVAFLATDIGVVSYYSRLYLLCFVLLAIAVSKSQKQVTDVTPKTA